MENYGFCINCGKPATALHHIVPLVLGGNDIPSNIAPLCDECHGKIHGVAFKNGNLSHSDLIRQGIARKKEAMERGEIYKGRNYTKKTNNFLGRPKKTKKDIPAKFKRLYKNHAYNSIADLANKCGISKGTAYNYIKLINE